MRAVTWQGKEQIEVAEVPDLRIQTPTDAIVQEGYLSDVLPTAYGT